MNATQRITGLSALAVTSAVITSVMFAPAAQAEEGAAKREAKSVFHSSSTSRDDEFCSNGEIDANGNCVVLSDVHFGTAPINIREVAHQKAKLEMVNKGKVMLNVSAKPIPQQQRARCWSVAPGTVIRNEVIVPGTGKHVTISWVVTADDNTFCTKEGFGNQVFKVSCNNRVWGVPGQPHQPPPQLPHVRGHFEVMDYAKWRATMLLLLTKDVSAHVRVESSDGLCVAEATIENKVKMKTKFWAVFKSRSVIEARSEGPGKVIQKGKHSQKLRSRFETWAKLKIKGSASALCQTGPGDNLPKAITHTPMHLILDGGQQPGGEGRAKGFLEASDPDRTITAADVTITGDQYVAVQNVQVVSFRFDGSPCPAATTCFQYDVVAARVTPSGTHGFVNWEVNSDNVTVKGQSSPIDVSSNGGGFRSSKKGGGLVAV